MVRASSGKHAGHEVMTNNVFHVSEEGMLSKAFEMFGEPPDYLTQHPLCKIVNGGGGGWLQFNGMVNAAPGKAMRSRLADPALAPEGLSLACEDTALGEFVKCTPTLRRSSRSSELPAC